MHWTSVSWCSGDTIHTRESEQKQKNNYNKASIYILIDKKYKQCLRLENTGKQADLTELPVVSFQGTSRFFSVCI